MGGFTVPDGWAVQAFQFALDPTAEQEACLRRQFGGRRYARNWAVRTLRDDIAAYRETGQETGAPSLAGLRKRWNQAKDAECTDAGTGEVWWPHISKEAFADGIKGAVNAYWNWQSSRAGTRQGRRVGFPRFAKKGRDRDRVTFTTGAIRVEPDRRHVTLPKVGTVRVHENTRRLQRLIARGRARILAVTVSRKGTRLVAAFRVLLQRPVQPRVTSPGSRAGVDVGVRVLATVATSEGEVIERVPNPRPLEAALKELRHLSRQRSRRTRGSRRYKETQRKITRLQRRAADIRAHHVHALTTRLAKTHGEIVAEGLDAAGMLAQRGLSGARARRRGLSDSALGETRRQLAYNAAGTAPAWSWRAAGFLPPGPAMSAGACRTSGGRNTGPAPGAGPATSATTTPRSTSRATRNPPPWRAIAPSAQSGPRSSAEPTARPGRAGQVAMRRGRDPAPGPGNNPETGCRRDEHYRSLTGNGSWSLSASTRRSAWNWSATSACSRSLPR
jgi:putative transposase